MDLRTENHAMSGAGMSSDELYVSTGSEVAAVLRAAHDAALDMTRRADEEARRILLEAEAEANRLRAQADDEVLRLRMQARVDEDRRYRELEQEFARARVEAEEEERRRREEADAEVQRHGEQVVGQIRDAIKRIDVEHRRLRQSIDDASAWVERTLGPALDSSVVERLSPTSGISGTEER